MNEDQASLRRTLVLIQENGQKYKVGKAKIELLKDERNATQRMFDQGGKA